MEQRKYPQRPVGSHQIEIRHAPSDQRMSLADGSSGLAEIVTNVQTRHPRSESLARLVHAEEFGYGVAQRLGAVIRAHLRYLRHRLAQHASSDRVSLGVVGFQ